MDQTYVDGSPQPRMYFHPILLVPYFFPSKGLFWVHQTIISTIREYLTVTGRAGY